MLEVNELQVGAIYEVSARNFGIAVYVGDSRFIGVRSKFGIVALDTEFHWNFSEVFGTVKPIKQVGIVPASIEISQDSLGLCEFLRLLRTHLENEHERRK